MHPEYDNWGTPEGKLIEECAEVIHAVCKLQRFGPHSISPHMEEGKQYTNVMQVIWELGDLKRRIGEWEEHCDASYFTETGEAK